MTAKVFDTATGKYIEDSDYARVTEKAAKGEYRFGVQVSDGSKAPDVPAVNLQDGKFYWLPPENAAQAFADGAFRYGSPDDLKANQDRTLASETKRINEENFGDLGGQIATAGEGFVAGATGGLSRTLLNDNAEQAVRTAREVNPISSVVGEIGGTLSPLGVGGAASKLGAAVTKGALERTAGNLVSRVGATGLGQAVEGAALGLGAGISEAALGDPNQIAEHVMAGAGWGSVLGGGLGVGGKLLMESAPLLKAAGKGVSEATAGIRRSVAENVLSNSAERAAFKEGAELPLADRSMYFGEDAVSSKAAIKAAAKEAKELQAEATKQWKDINNSIVGETKEVKSLVEKQIIESKSIYQAQQDLLSSGKQQLNAADSMLANYVDTPGSIAQKVYDDTYVAIKKLEATKNAQAVELAQDLKNSLGSKLKFDADAGVYGSVFDEITAARNIRTRANEIIKNGDYGSDIKTPLVSLTDNLRGMIRNHPQKDIAEVISKADDYYSSAWALGDFLRIQNDKGPLRGLIKNLYSPDVQGVLDRVIRNAPEFTDVFKRYAETSKDVIARKQVIKDTKDILNRFNSSTLDNRQSPEAIQQVLEMIGAGKNSTELLEKFANTKKLVTNLGNMTPADQLIAMRQAAGKPVEKDLIDMSKRWSSIDKMAQIEAKHAAQRTPGQSATDKFIQRTVGGSVLGGGLGYVTGDAEQGRTMGGAALGAMYGMRGIRGDAYAGIKALTAIQTAAAAGAKKIAQATEAAIKSITSGKVSKAIISQGAKKGATFEEKKKEYVKQKKLLTDHTDPAVLADNLTEKFAYLDGAPNIKVAMGSHLSNTINFLNSKLPSSTAGDINPLFRSKVSETPSDAELSKFYRYVKAAENPASVVDSLASGRVSKEEVETVRALYPVLYEGMQTGIMEAIASGKAEKMTYEHRIALGTLFGISTDPSLEPKMLTRLQANYVEKDEGGRPPEVQAGMATNKPTKADFSKTTNMAATDLQRIAARS